MTSPRFSERTTRTERPDFSPRKPVSTVRRGLKKRGVLPSFGDMILPIVGVFAVVLLVIFGRQFFLNGLNSSPGIASTRAYAEAPAILAELERSRLEAEAAAKVPETVSPVSEDVVAKSQDVKEEEDLFVLAVAVQQNKTPAVNNKAANKETVTVKSSPAQKKQTQTPAKNTTKTTQKSGSSSVSESQWRVQVGAYTTKAGAQDA
ncbi:MAG: hypothetical protein IJ597_00605, partial [Synergistaceae bacterium]|nr:hypothetical protein [Synergistaceae bacterium]